MSPSLLIPKQVKLLLYDLYKYRRDRFFQECLYTRPILSRFISRDYSVSSDCCIGVITCSAFSLSRWRCKFFLVILYQDLLLPRRCPSQEFRRISEKVLQRQIVIKLIVVVEPCTPFVFFFPVSQEHVFSTLVNHEEEESPYIVYKHVVEVKVF